MTENKSQMEKLQVKYEVFRESLKESELVKEVLELLQKDNVSEITNIRCLALGSPEQSNVALYQLAFLVILAESLKCINISIYDPIITGLDEKFIKSLSTEFAKYSIEEKIDISNDNIDKYLFFLPHAELSLMEELLKLTKPKLILGNELGAHTDSFTKRKLFETYPYIAHLKNVNETSHTPQDDFTIVKSKRLNRKKSIFIEPKLDYYYEKMYFEKLQSYKIQNVSGPWDNAFSDLALQIIS